MNEQYQVSFGDAIKRAFSNYCKFTGRASRSEYWWFALFVFIASIALGFLSGLLAGLTMKGNYSGLAMIPLIIFCIIIILPSWGLLFRRLHDTGRSGWWCLINFIPYIGGIILLIFCCQSSEPFDNKYGSVPNTRYFNSI